MNYIIALVVLFIILFIVSKAIGESKKKAQLHQQKMERIALIKPFEKRIKNFEEYSKELYNLYPHEIDKEVSRVIRHFKLVDKYGDDIGAKLSEYKYWLGMTEEHLRDCRGEPQKIETEVLKTKTKRILIYGNKSSGDVFVFVNGELERFTDR